MMDIDSFSGRIKKNNPPGEDLLSTLIEKIDFAIDKQFLFLMRRYNGVSGCMNEGKYFIIWSIEDILKINPYYDFIEQCKNLFFFGSDGSGIVYAFNKTNRLIVSMRYSGIGAEDPKIIASSFDKFLEYVFHPWPCVYSDAES